MGCWSIGVLEDSIQTLGLLFTTPPLHYPITPLGLS
jgi:hypothetical protein